jgi:dihydroflavonol-4-reductase
VIQEFTGRKTPKAVVPAFVAQMGLPFMTLYAKLRNEDPLYTKDSLDILKTCNVFIQNEKAKKEIGYSPRSIRDTLGDSFEWYKAHGMID